MGGRCRGPAPPKIGTVLALEGAHRWWVKVSGPLLWRRAAVADLCRDQAQGGVNIAAGRREERGHAGSRVEGGVTRRIDPLSQGEVGGWAMRTQ